MRLFVTGVCGQLGHDVISEAVSKGYECIGSDVTPEYSGINEDSFISNAQYLSLDITDKDAVMSAMNKVRPDAIIHCAAWTDVDGAENEENRPKVYIINHKGTQYLAEAAKAVDAKMVYISTDYVFNGMSTAPWKPDDKNYEPLNIYGQSKLEGELEVSGILNRYFIVRTAWVFGSNGNNFIKTMINLGYKNDTVRVVNDQIGTPTYTKDLARLLVDMIETEKYGYYHATNSETQPGGYISWYDFTKEIYKQSGMDVNVIPVSTAEYGLSKALRPFNSRLDKTKLIEAGFKPLPDWKDALARYLEEAKLYLWDK